MDITFNLLEEIEESLQDRSHQPAGPIYKNLCKRHALMSFRNKDDIKGIYSLTESHAPTYRIKTTYRYDKILTTTENTNEITLNKEYISFDCPTDFSDGIKTMLNIVEELPKEWTLVQISTRFNIKESMQINISSIYTDPLHMCIFNCGQNNIEPVHVNVTAPKDINGEIIELCKEMRSIIDENKTLLLNCFGADTNLKNATAKQKKTYTDKRSTLNNRLKDIILQMEKKWLKEWRCLLVGKFVNEETTSEIFNRIDEFIQNSNYKMTNEVQYLLHQLIASCEFLSSNELLKGIDYCIPDNKDLRGKVYKEILNIANSFIFKNLQRHPVLLIVDEQLDCFPWEMIDVLIDHPVSRMPSLRFTYALYKEHEKFIVNGYRQVSCSDGSYIINPGLDLKKMELRLKEFFNYWLPEWKGLVGQTPTSEEFIECLTGGDIFVYNGHGSGTQFLSANKIQQIRVNSVVLLFGCSSTRMTPMGPFVEMYDVFHNYLIACSPCVVGMLWEVTDFDTDILCTSLLSHWIPSNAEPHWKLIDKVKWEKGTINPLSNNAQKQKSSSIDWEPELLRAKNIAQRESVQFLTKCAIVARGLPIKIVQ